MKVLICVIIIIFAISFSSCSAIFLDTEYKNELNSINSLIKNENYSIEISIIDYGESNVAFGPLFLPIIPLSFPPFRGPSNFGLLIKVVNKENSSIKDIISVQAFNEKGKEIKHFDKNEKYNRLYIRQGEEIKLAPMEHIHWYDSSLCGVFGYYCDTLVYNKLSKLYESKKCLKPIGLYENAGDQRYVCYFKTNKKLKNVALKIKYIDSNDEEITLSPIKYNVDYKYKYDWNALQP